MKQLVYIIVFIVLILIPGCANNSYKMMEKDAAASTEIYEAEEVSFSSLEDAYMLLITEKLQDYLDTQTLAAQHPEFNNATETSLFSAKNAKEIRQIKFLGQPETIADSITKIITKVEFDKTKTDTIISYIKTSYTLIDGVKFRTSKATFEKVKPSKKEN